MASAERWCPYHAQAGVDEAHAWPCPDDCQDFLAELERRIEDVDIHGNFVRMWKAADGLYYKQEFRNHEPVGEPVAWRVMNEEQE